MIYRIYNCDFGIIHNGVNYNFDHVDGFLVEDPETTKLTRGSNAGKKRGITYKEGVKEPKKITITLVGITADLFNMLSTIYDSETRIEAFAIDRKTGSSKIAKNAILSSKPQQLTIDENPDSQNVTLNIETFNFTEKQKD